MVIDLFFRGAAVGFVMAAPIGPIGTLVIRRSLADGLMLGLVTGLGAAVADALYGALGAFGLRGVSGFIIGQGLWLKVFGGLFLCHFGASVFRTPIPAADRPGTAPHNLAAFASTVLLTLANPLTLLSFVAVFAGFGIGPGAGAAAAMVAGVFLGSSLWWLLLSSALSLLRRRLAPAVLAWINRGSGLLLCAYGGTELASVWRAL